MPHSSIESVPYQLLREIIIFNRLCLDVLSNHQQIRGSITFGTRSLVKPLNKRGPRVEPCSTRDSVEHYVEDMPGRTSCGNLGTTEIKVKMVQSYGTHPIQGHEGLYRRPGQDKKYTDLNCPCEQKGGRTSVR
jgi:hypothetical protein